MPFKKIDHFFGVSFGHPAFLADHYHSDMYLPSSPMALGLNFTVESLARLLMFGTYVRAKALSMDKTVDEVVEQELSKFPYTRKRKFQV